jgi:Fe-S cluster assembly iron-binding protein IscA
MGIPKSFPILNDHFMDYLHSKLRKAFKVKGLRFEVQGLKIKD